MENCQDLAEPTKTHCCKVTYLRRFGDHDGGADEQAEGLRHKLHQHNRCPIRKEPAPCAPTIIGTNGSMKLHPWSQRILSRKHCAGSCTSMTVAQFAKKPPQVRLQKLGPAVRCCRNTSKACATGCISTIVAQVAKKLPPVRLQLPEKLRRQKQGAIPAWLTHDAVPAPAGY